jgi:cellulose synthase/poly-beta-1,6-N-acetylglucosamine synthase-like glycosyltransferase
MAIAFGIYSLLLILSALAYLSFFVLCIRAWNAIELDALPKHYHGTKPVTIIVPARNEELYLKSCINSLLKQTYQGPIEIIVINDHSTDGTATILATYGAAIKVINWAEAEPMQLKAYKKKAISMAVEQAKGELIITTDADTIRDVHWVAAMVHYFEHKNVKLIAGPVTYAPQRGFIALFETVDFLMMQGISAAGLEYDFYHSCNGANMMYSKGSFHAVKGYTQNDNQASGDDVFLLKKIAAKYKNGARYLLNPKAIVTTNATNSLRGFLQQRIRWAGKATAYKDAQSKWVLGITALLNLLILLTLVLCCFGLFSWVVFAFALVAKVIPEFILLNKVLGFFDRKKLLFWHLLLQPIHWIYIIFCGAVAPFVSTQWKGRNI